VPIQQSPFAVVLGAGARRADLPKWATPHDLRHYFASVLIRSGASVKVVQARLGHSSTKTTLDVYGHLFADEEDRRRDRRRTRRAMCTRCAPAGCSEHITPQVRGYAMSNIVVLFPPTT